MTFRYTVSLQVKHPEYGPESIVTAIGLPAVRSWSVGEERTTPKGTLLQGRYRESYCVFDLGDGDDGELADFLRKILINLEHAASFIKELRQTGGKFNFYVQWTVGERGEVFDIDLLSEMARIGIDLGIEPLVP